MAYSSDKLVKITRERHGIAPTVWAYQTSDPFPTVEASGYIADATNKGVRVGDIVMVANTGSGYQPASLTVSAISSGAATLSGGPGPVAVADAATYTVLAVNSGKDHNIPDLTADCTISLPTADAGLSYTFVYTGVAADAQDWIIDTGSDTNFFLGGVLHVDDLPAADSVAGDGNSNSKLTVLTPEAGTRVTVACDGTNWILSGTVVSLSAP